mmetsp:Transcript_38312/g.62286  ORF Transcript_38312/g.62286 Transcript_38312/m.62286 type:complete len:215 (+) Transcript_38312:225-869(+)
MTIDDLMIARLKRKFLRLGRRGVDLPDFCTIFYDTLGMYFPLANKNEILSALMHVFEDIDIRGQKVIRWETLLDHLAEMAVQYHKMHGANLETKEYAPSEHVRDHSHHDNKIAFIQHYNTINKTVLLERGNPVIKLYDSETLSLDMTLKGHRRAVLCVDVVQSSPPPPPPPPSPPPPSFLANGLCRCRSHRSSKGAYSRARWGHLAGNYGIMGF